MKILLIGPQGSGKSTQAKLLSEYLNIPVISTGDIFRKQASVNEIIRTVLQEGKLVDDITTSQVVKDRLNEEDCRNGFIMDGYPRNLEQVKLFDPQFDKVIFLNVPEDLVIQRLLKRGRADDTEELIKTRLDLYYKQTQPLLDYYKGTLKASLKGELSSSAYKKLGKLVEVNGSGDVQAIQDEIKKSV